MFDAPTYFSTIHSSLKATKDDYHFCKVSGLSHLEQVIQNMKNKKKFFAIDETDDGMTFEGGGQSFFERRTYTVFLLLYFGKINDIEKRNKQIQEARQVYRQILSKIIRDKHRSTTAGLQYLVTDNIKFDTIPTLMNGYCGLFFSIDVENPINLSYDATQWE